MIGLRLQSVVLLAFVDGWLIFGCPLFKSQHCHADCSLPLTNIICQNVQDAELQSVLEQYANISSKPLRLTIQKSPQLHFTARVFSSVIAQLQDLQVESDTIVNEIPKGAFKELANLRSLDLSNNRIAHLHPDDFAGLHNIQNIKLERNPLIDIASGVFDDLKKLQCLDLDHNALTCDCKLLWLKQWSASHPQFWQDDRIISDESGEECDGDIPDCEYPPLMKDRNVTEIPDDICRQGPISGVACLELQTAHCTTYCDNWTPMQIQCSNVGYSELKNLLEKYSKLTDRVLRLDITKSSNLVLNTTLFEAVKVQLVHLRLDHSKVHPQPRMFANLEKLVYLEMEDCEVTGNGLSRGMFDGLTALRGLNLDDTNVDHMDEGLFAPLKSLACLNMDEDDDGVCECDMKWMRTWMHNHTDVFDEKVLMYDYGLKVFCDGDAVDCSVKNSNVSQDDC
ncbi:hypothetical protein RvY_15181 [Ramazzottius varieornatus]|uniref:LRRCT domain-containing protein n=1 Tax=Ramazzottius varieornatus TaxID=947166 RepID=A0A1D1VYT3_RAMVA|nr:hypothetical protein RvY_15181 [Ramazzottius varieornatus]